MKFISAHLITYITDYVKENIVHEYKDRKMFKQYVDLLEHLNAEISQTLKKVKE